MVCVYVLFVQCCSRPHCAHRLGAGAPHWHPPCGTQHAQFCLTKSWLQRHPCDSCVHKSTWPAKKIDRKHTKRRNNIVVVTYFLLSIYYLYATEFLCAKHVKMWSNGKLLLFRTFERESKTRAILKPTRQHRSIDHIWWIKPNRFVKTTRGRCKAYRANEEKNFSFFFQIWIRNDIFPHYAAVTFKYKMRQNIILKHKTKTMKTFIKAN